MLFAIIAAKKKTFYTNDLPNGQMLKHKSNWRNLQCPTLAFFSLKKRCIRKCFKYECPSESSSQCSIKNIVLTIGLLKTEHVLVNVMWFFPLLQNRGCHVLALQIRVTMIKKKRHVYSVYCNTSGHHKLTVPLFFRRKTYQSKALISQIVAAVCGFVVVYLSFNMCFKGLKTFNT